MSLIRVDNIADQDGDNTISTYQMIAILKNLSELFAMLASSDPAEVANAQKAFGMGTAAALDVGTAPGNLVRMATNGLWGLGQTSTGNYLANLDATDTPAGFYNITPATTSAAALPTSYGSMLVMRGSNANNTAFITQFVAGNNGVGYLRTYTGGVWGVWNTAVAADSGWITIDPIGANWTVTENRPLRYRKIGNQVFFQGAITGGNPNNSIVTLPVGFRPQFVFVCPIYSVNNSPANTINSLQVGTDGNVLPRVNNNSYVSFDNISFFVN